jgi:hypothetical protein
MNPLLIICLLNWPPALAEDATVDSGSSPSLLNPGETLREGIAIAEKAPAVDFLYYDCQTYEPNPGVWSNWGDGLAVGDKYYSAIGDHSSPGGNAFVYEYDSTTKTNRLLLDLRSILKVPDGEYTPGKIHSRLDLGKDGWLYFSTHRGSTKIAFHETANYQGDWILRFHIESGKTEVVAHSPLPKQCLPASVLDPERLIFYAGTADGLNEKEPTFLAYDATKREVLFSHPKGFARSAIFARSTGRLYFHDSKNGAAAVMCFDPESPNQVRPTGASVGLRAATIETSDHQVYTVDRDQLWVFDTASETARELGPAAVASQDYTASIDIDPKTERYLYYVPGAHGGAQKDNSPLIQYDVKTKKRKVIAFLHPYLLERTGYIPMGTYSTAVSPEGDRVYITWNGNRGGEDTSNPKRPKLKFNTCALTVVHIPESERMP